MIASGTMKMRLWRRSCAACLVWVSFAAILDAQRAAIHWDVPSTVDPGDRRDILDIARRLGITDPRSAWTIASACRLVYIESTPIVDGDRVRSTLVGVRRLRGPECSSPRGGQRVVQQGNWIAFLGDVNPRHREQWRVRDGAWHIDITIGADVPYEDAVSVVIAIRRRELVDRRPPVDGVPSPMTYVDPSEIFSIRADPGRPAGRPATPGLYQVMTGKERGGVGNYLEVRVQRDTVELIKQGIWMT